MGSIDRKDREASPWILAVLDAAPSVDVTPHTMLRSEEFLQVHFRRVVKDVNGGAKVTVYAAWIGDQADPFAFESLEIPSFKDLYSSAYGL